MDPTLKLTDRTAFVVNPNSRYGRAIVHRLAECGANVALVDSQPKETERLAEEIMNLREVHEKRGRAGMVLTDFKTTQSITDAVSKAAEMFGGVDIYIDAHTAEKSMSFAQDFTSEKFDELLQLNLKSTLLMTHKIVQYFKVRRRGRIIYLVSDLQRVGFEKEAMAAASRMGLMTFAKGLAKEMVTENVTVNCLAVGPSEEYLLQRFPEAKTVQLAQEELLKSLKAFRMIDSTEVANTACYLASPLASGITGQTIAVSGGLSVF